MATKDRGYRRDPILSALDEIGDSLREENRREFQQLSRELGTVDRSRLPDIAGEYGSAGRTRPAWERAYDTAARTYGWDDEMRKWRTPAHDLETVEFIR